MTCNIGTRVISAFLAGLLTFSCTSWSALAGTHNGKKAIAADHVRYYLYSPAAASLPSAPHPLRDGHEMCWLPSDGCDNNRSITN
ncbi:MAG: hypothetical protein C5B58_03575 [Acidobacteria bacterium]|nr:MAG: hypothetical protein C5B58_03575 [Acidobacteriota bacterium]